MPPLDNLKVIDLTRVLAGPFCAMLLGDMGANVIKIEEPAAGDDARGWAPFVGDWSAYFLGVNRSKRSLALDLKQPGASDVLRRLLTGADVFIENFKPGSLDKLGFAYEQTRALNSRLVHCSISGYGKNGRAATCRGTTRSCRRNRASWTSRARPTARRSGPASR